MSSVKKQAVKGTIWTLVGYGGAQGLRLVSNLILTRILVPELFGLMALVHTFIMGVALFSDIGIRPSIIRSPRWNDPVFLNTAWTLQVLRSCWIWIGCLILAWPVSQFYNDSRLLWLLPVAALTILINGFASTSLATLSRKLEIGKITIVEFGTQIISLAVTIIWASITPTVWALVGGNIVSSIIKTVWSHRLDPESSNWFAWEKETLKEILSFGRWVFVSTMMTFLASQADRLILGRLFTLQLLGVYTVAFTFADLPRQIVHRISQQIMFPVISKYADLDRPSLRAKILQKRKLLLMGLAVMVTVLASFGDIIIEILYDERYQEAGWMLPILAVGLWPLLLSATIDRALYAIGNPKSVAFGHSLKFLYMITVLPAGYKLFGIVGAITVIAFNDLPSYCAVNYGLWQEKLSCFRQDLLATLLMLGLLFVVCLGRYSLGFGLPIDGVL
ncbi:oligosaccharide flippase family protein [Limnoraphis robusta Tam1]|uniref:oligosaccharide flippase family protein n=1 Tax=Limnoraphis robusta TaxID=1118279 RepID=UPI002B20204B|nr:oligosaccharide flippase family protein [Limnoraphis robusta]MEA5541401.1 oligosaccharide flippase family protein [Limnoraphis robusta Tam1]